MYISRPHTFVVLVFRSRKLEEIYRSESIGGKSVYTYCKIYEYFRQHIIFVLVFCNHKLEQNIADQISQRSYEFAYTLCQVNHIITNKYTSPGTNKLKVFIRYQGKFLYRTICNLFKTFLIRIILGLNEISVYLLET